MTIIKPNSIAGVTSITAQGDVINLYKSDGTLAGLQLNGVNFNTTSGVSTFNNVTVGGTITYQDVAHVDSVGIITAQQGLQVLANGLNITGVSTFSDDVIVGLSTFFVDVSTGRVGIGTDNPSAIFHSYHPTTNTVARFESGDASVNIRFRDGDTTNQIGIGALGNDFIVTAASGGERFRVTSSGNIGIGTTNPSATVTSANTAKLAVGIVSAYQFYGDGSQLSGISVGLTTESASPNNTITHLDLTNAQDHKLIVSGITTISVTGGSEADSHTIRIQNSGISTVGFSTYFLFPSGAAPSLPTADGAISLISFTVHRVGAAGTQLLAGASVNFS